MKLTQELIENWVLNEATGEFHYTKVLDGKVTEDLFPYLRTIMQRMKEKGLAYPVGKKDGWWRAADIGVEEVHWWDTDGDIEDKIKFPLGINDYCHIPQPSLIICAGRYNAGKGHPLGTPILLDDGFVNIENVKVGDKVLTPSGERANIIGTYRRGIQSIYKFTFSDGTEIEVDQSHIWLVQPLYNRQKLTSKGHPNSNYGKWIFKTTEQIIQKTGLGDIYKHFISIPRTKPIKHFGYQLPMASCPPYLLGLLLGDGNLTGQGIRFSTQDQELLDYIESLGINLKYIGKYDYKLRLGEIRLPNNVKKLAHEKSIPRSYLLTFVYHRKALLAGLLDTDGWVDKQGNANFSTVSEQLAKQVSFLVESLGGRASISSQIKRYSYRGENREGRRAFNVYIRFKQFCPFRLKRKATLWKPYKKSLHRIISRIEYVGEKESICIATDSPEELYIAKDFIVTHNTAFAINTVYLNMDLWKDRLHFYVSEGAEMIGKKFDSIDGYIPKPPPWKTYRRTEHFADLIKKHPNDLHVIDYVRVNMEQSYAVSTDLFHIYNALGPEGIAIAMMQKPPGRKLAFGGAGTAFEPSLYISMDDGYLEFEKIKIPKILSYDPYSIKIRFSINKGVNFLNVHTEVE